MKNIFKLFLITLVGIFTTTSCLEDTTDIADGGVAVANIVPPSISNFIFGVTTEITLDFNKAVNAPFTITSVDVSKQLFTALGDSEIVTVAGVTAESHVETVAELFANVPVGGNVLTPSDLAPGDLWSFSYKINISDGSVLTIAATTVSNFACPSNIPTSGTWSGTSTDNSFGVGTQSNTGVTITAIDSDGNYSMSDITAGFYLAFSFNLSQPGNVNELCNKVTIIDAPDAQFDISTGSPGSWDPVTTNLVIIWYDNGNAFGETATYVHVP